MVLIVESINTVYKFRGQMIQVYPFDSLKMEVVNKEDSNGFSTFGGPWVTHNELTWKLQSYLSIHH